MNIGHRADAWPMGETMGSKETQDMQTTKLMELKQARVTPTQADVVDTTEMAHKVAFYHGAQATARMTDSELQEAYDEIIDCEAVGHDVPYWG